MEIKKSVAWRWGELAQKAVQNRYIKELGYYVVPTHAIETGGAPMLIGLIKKFILPDMQIFKPGQAARWVEVKFKDHTDLFQKKRQWQHAIDLPNWYAYLEVEQKTGIAGQLDLLVFKPGRNASHNPHHLFQSFQELKLHIQEGPADPKFRRGRACFPMGAWRCAPITVDVPIDLPSLVENENPWERKSKAGVAPAWEIKFTDKSPFEIQRDRPPVSHEPYEYYNAYNRLVVANAPAPDLHVLIRQYGTYRAIPPQAWAEYDRAIAEWRAKMWGNG